jgi:nucleotide-binding universal stress UspA family protein
MYSTIVVGTDGSDTARKAVGEAIKLASENDAVLHIVSAYKPLKATGSVGISGEQWAVNSASQVDGVLQEAVSVARRSGVKTEIHAERTDPADAVNEVAKQFSADLVVVGNKGMKGARRILGSVPNTIAHEAPCSVLIVKTT